MKNWLRCFTLIILFSCTGKGVPSGILPQQKMGAVIWDMVQADQYYKEYVLKDSLKEDVKTERLKLYERVFQIHQITRETFDKSYAYYAAHPKLMQDVMDTLQAKGTRKLEDFYKPAIQPVDTTPRSLLRKRLDTLKVK